MFGLKRTRCLSSSSIVFSLAALSLALTIPCAAQVTSGTILGRVTDPSGAAVANAKVDVVNVGTNIHTEITTNPSGNFEVPYFGAGQYEVTFDAKGFQQFRQTGSR